MNVFHVTGVQLAVKLGIIGYRNHAERLLNILDHKRGCSVEFIYHPTKKFKDVRCTNNLEDLLSCGKAYRCFASKEELDQIRKETGSYHYNGLWRNKSDDDINRELEKKTPFTIRIKSPNEGHTVFDDMIYGSISISNSEIDDFTISRSDGSPVYNFTNVIDDQSMKITHVVRGEDHISNTPKQILIYKAFNWEPPIFAHLPMILGEDKKRLSKRHGATGVQSYRDEGFQPEALLNYLALLGWNPGTEEEIMDLEQQTLDANEREKAALAERKDAAQRIKELDREVKLMEKNKKRLNDKFTTLTSNLEKAKRDLASAREKAAVTLSELDLERETILELQQDVEKLIRKNGNH